MHVSSCSAEPFGLLVSFGLAECFGPTGAFDLVESFGLVDACGPAGSIGLDELFGLVESFGTADLFCLAGSLDPLDLLSLVLFFGLADLLTFCDLPIVRVQHLGDRNRICYRVHAVNLHHTLCSCCLTKDVQLVLRIH